MLGTRVQYRQDVWRLEGNFTALLMQWNTHLVSMNELCGTCCRWQYERMLTADDYQRLHVKSRGHLKDKAEEAPFERVCLMGKSS